VSVKLEAAILAQYICNSVKRLRTRVPNCEDRTGFEKGVSMQVIPVSDPVPEFAEHSSSLGAPTDLTETVPPPMMQMQMQQPVMQQPMIQPMQQQMQVTVPAETFPG
jgi:hypothetical protein